MSVAAILELAVPYASGDLFDLGYDQTADVLQITHPDYPARKISRYSHTLWTSDEITFGTTVAAPTGFSATPTEPVTTGAHPVDYDYVVTAVNEEIGQESLPSASDTASNDLSLYGNFNTLAWTASPTATAYNLYKGLSGQLGFIGQTTSTTFKDDNIAADYSDSYPRARDVFNAENQYPATVTFFGQRAYYGRTLAKPYGIYGSQVGDFYNFNASRPSQADDAVTFGVLARRVNAIQHMVPMDKLIVFTTDTIFAMSGVNGGAITPSSIDLKPQGYRGASKVRPQVADDIIFYGTSTGSRLRTLNYTFERDGYRGNDITVFSRHLFKNHDIVDMAWCEEPSQVLWAIRSDGKAATLTWMAEQDVWGWSLCETAGNFESCCSVIENGEAVLYAVIQRPLATGTFRHIERLSTINWTGISDCVFLDAARRTFGAELVTHIAGLGYLEGETVTALCDGSVVTGLVVTGGAITVPSSENVLVGLPYEAWVKTLPIVGQGNSGSTKGQPGALANAQITFDRTRGVEVGLGKRLAPGVFEPTSSDDEITSIYEVAMRQENESLAEVPELRSGTYECPLDTGDWTEDTACVVVRQRNPLPMTVLGIVPKYEAAG